MNYCDSHSNTIQYDTDHQRNICGDGDKASPSIARLLSEAGL